LDDSFECVKMHGPTNPKLMKAFGGAFIKRAYKIDRQEKKHTNNLRVKYSYTFDTEK